jgi:hypothetical protein
MPPRANPRWQKLTSEHKTVIGSQWKVQKVQATDDLVA